MSKIRRRRENAPSGRSQRARARIARKAISYQLEQGTDPLRIEDPETLRKLEEARDRIIWYWLLSYGSAPTFTNTSGSPADLLDLNIALNALSGKFYNVE